jgi:hypothetical protein
LNFRAYQLVASGITNRLKTIDFIGQSTASSFTSETYQNKPGAAQLAAQNEFDF